MKTIKTALIITSISSKVDDSLRIGACTPELSPKEKVAFMELQNIPLEALFKPKGSKDVKEVKGELDSKSRSQLLRNSLFVLWTKRGKKGDSNDFYIKWMDKFREIVFEKINETKN